MRHAIPAEARSSAAPGYHPAGGLSKVNAYREGIVFTAAALPEPTAALAATQAVAATQPVAATALTRPG